MLENMTVHLRAFEVQSDHPHNGPERGRGPRYSTSVTCKTLILSDSSKAGFVFHWQMRSPFS